MPISLEFGMSLTNKWWLCVGIKMQYTNKSFQEQLSSLSQDECRLIRCQTPNNKKDRVTSIVHCYEKMTCFGRTLRTICSPCVHGLYPIQIRKAWTTRARDHSHYILLCNLCGGANWFRVLPGARQEQSYRSDCGFNFIDFVKYRIRTGPSSQ